MFVGMCVGVLRACQMFLTACQVWECSLRWQFSLSGREIRLKCFDKRNIFDHRTPGNPEIWTQDFNQTTKHQIVFLLVELCNEKTTFSGSTSGGKVPTKVARIIIMQLSGRKWVWGNLFCKLKKQLSAEKEVASDPSFIQGLSFHVEAQSFISKTLTLIPTAEDGRQISPLLYAACSCVVMHEQC